MKRMAGLAAACILAATVQAGDVVRPVHAGSQEIFGGSTNATVVDLNAAGANGAGDTFTVDLDTDEVIVSKHGMYRVDAFAMFQDPIGDAANDTLLYVQVMRGSSSDPQNAILVGRAITPCNGQLYPNAHRSFVIRMLPNEKLFLCVWYGGNVPLSARLHPANGSQATMSVELIKELE